MKKVDYNKAKEEFPERFDIPKWLRWYNVLIKTRRRNKYFITKGLSFCGTWRIPGFTKAKILGFKNNEI